MLWTVTPTGRPLTNQIAGRLRYVPRASSVLTVFPGRVVLGECCGSAAEAGRASPLHCLGTVVDLEFGEYVAYVVSDGFG